MVERTLSGANKGGMGHAGVYGLTLAEVPINSGPAAASTGLLRLELFALGHQNQLLVENWRCRRWVNGILWAE